MAVSYLFIPGNSERKLVKGLQSNADAVIIDLEDAVVPEEKHHARHLVVRTLQQIQKSNQKIYVRVNSYQTEWHREDLTAICQLRSIKGIMLPKSEGAEAIKAVSSFLQDEQELIPLIETAKGIHLFNELATASDKIKKVAFGSVDYALDIGTEWTEEGIERKFAMGVLTVGSRALGLEPPIDAVFPIIENTESFLRDTEIGKKTGFYGKLIIHPKHIDLVQKVYAPTEKQIEWSKLVIELFESDQHQGAIQLDGKLIDLPIYLLAKRIINQIEEVKS